MRCKWGLGSNKDRGRDPGKKGTNVLKHLKNPE